MDGQQGDDNGANGAAAWAGWLPPPAFASADMPPGAAEAPAMAPPPAPAPQAAVRRVVTLAESGPPERPMLPQHAVEHAPSGAALPLQGAPRMPMPHAMTAYPPRTGMHPPMQLGEVSELDMFQGHMLGASTLIVGAGSLLGAHFGGIYGGIAGALFAGASINGLRAGHALLQSPPQKKEALVSGIYGSLAVLMGGFILWKLDKKKAGQRWSANPSRRARNNSRRSCDIRPIGL